jgi:tRNA-uridine 2-sulfurtransferase
MDRQDTKGSAQTARGSVYGGKVADSLVGKSNLGRLESPSGVGQAGSADCGALVRVEVAVEGGTVVEAKYQAYGCPATLACAAAAVEKAQGVPILEAARVGSVELAASLELAPDKIYAAETAIEALHAALGAAVAAGASLPEVGEDHDPLGVLVGMSGGVDSSVAALLLRGQGYRVVGVTLSLWNDPHSGGERSCCSPETVRRARRVAHSLGIPHLTIDATAAFSESVVSYFVEEYESGHTPNPCAKCNSRVRFGLMLEVARSLGLSWVSTGHYARLLGEDRSLARGADSAKDQSYVLAEVDPAVLRRVLFPLGDMTKGNVRQSASEAGLEGHGAPESQEICFVADDDHRRFLRDRLGDRPGLIVDQAGHELGGHTGTYNYTIGQRKGLNVPSQGPLYVVGIDAGRSEVVVGTLDELDVGAVRVGTLTWHGSWPAGPVSLQVRSSGEALTGLLEEDESTSDMEGTVTVVLDRPARAVALGQTAVVYRDEHVVCAGTIVATRSASMCGERGSRGGG